MHCLLTECAPKTASQSGWISPIPNARRAGFSLPHFTSIKTVITRFAALLILLAVELSSFASEGEKPAAIAFDPRRPITLRSSIARHQLLVTAKLPSAGDRDFTRVVQYTVAPEGIVSIDRHGLVSPVADGSATITATADNVSTQIAVKVDGCKSDRAINFANEVVPIFTKTGCNSGGCHGKSSGQNGFRLSLLGFEPTEDYEYLVREARGRRLF